MKKFLSITIIIFLLLGAMRPGIATHFCKGELAQAKVVYGYGEASCGKGCSIPAEDSDPQKTNYQKPLCCKDYFFTLAVDDYQFVSQNIITTASCNIPREKTPVFDPHHLTANIAFTSIPPPHITEVQLPIIQVFII